MRVSLSSIFSHTNANLQKLAEELQEINATIASGRKYQDITGDPVEVGALMGLTVDQGQVAQYQENLETGREWLATTEATLQSINEMLRGAMALANQMATGTYAASQRAAAAEQIKGYLEEMMQVGNARLKGHYLLSGYKIDTQPFAPGGWVIQPAEARLMPGSGYTGSATSSGTYVGNTSRTYVVEIVNGGAVGAAGFRVSEDGGRSWTTDPSFVTSTSPTPIWGGTGPQGVSLAFTDSGALTAGDRFVVAVNQPILYQGDENTLELAIGRGSRQAVNQVGSQALGGDGNPLDLFQMLNRLVSSLEANDPAAVGACLEELRRGQEHLNATLAHLGASLNRVDIKKGVFETLKEELATQWSHRGDTDLVAAVNALKSKEAAYQAALLGGVRLMGMSLVELLKP